MMEGRLIDHGGEKRICLCFPYQTGIIARIRQIPGSRYSRTWHAWHVPDTPAGRQQLLTLFPGMAWWPPQQELSLEVNLSAD